MQNPIISKILESRGIHHQDWKEFLSWDLQKLPSLVDLIDLEKASMRLIKALDEDEKIVVYGDYDVDGTTSCALLFHFFKLFNKEVILFQPDRLTEGYGLHEGYLTKAKEQNVKVFITVDCGITSEKEAIFAKELGIDLIITDHHQDILKTIPCAFAVINPSRRGQDKKGLERLAGVGVAFCLALEIKQKLEEQGRECPSIYPLLEFVALGTICDLAVLDNTNLRLCRHGLKQLKKSSFPGINAFLNEQEKKGPLVKSEKLAFYIGPLINSKGRIDSPEMSLQLLTCADQVYAYQLHAHLKSCNDQRKYIQANVLKEAKEQALKELIDDDLSITIVYGKDWHEGVIGIIASKLVDTYRVPAIVLTDSEDPQILKASVRSAGELDIFSELEKNSNLFNKFGGHEKAAGFSMPKKNLDKLKKNMRKQLKDVPVSIRTKDYRYDIELKFDEVTSSLVYDLDQLEPFGNGNPNPTFVMKDIYLESYKIMKDCHVKWSFKSKISSQRKKLQGISFFYIGKWGEVSPEDILKRQDTENLSIYFTLGINHFNGNQYLQLLVERLFFTLN